MNFDQYNATSSSEHTEYHFTSTGPKGDFPKIIQYTYVEEAQVYNLAFGLLREDGGIDDKYRTANGDTEKILATVGNTVLSFTEKYPDIPVFATGSDAIRTRLYRRMLSLYKDEIQKTFSVYGRKDGVWHEFEINIAYDAFLVIRRKGGKFDTELKTSANEEE